ncbi:hypothetical protein SOV_29960 [Sporomusa ovata DSM 2662]
MTFLLAEIFIIRKLLINIKYGMSGGKVQGGKIMSLLPEFSISFWNGWWFSLIYLIVNLGIPSVKKDAFKRLFKSPKSHEKF